VAAFNAERQSFDSSWRAFDNGHDVAAYSAAVQQSSIPALDHAWAALPPLIAYGS